MNKGLPTKIICETIIITDTRTAFGIYLQYRFIKKNFIILIPKNENVYAMYHWKVEKVLVLDEVREILNDLFIECIDRFNMIRATEAQLVQLARRIA